MCEIANLQEKSWLLAPRSGSQNSHVMSTKRPRGADEARYPGWKPQYGQTHANMGESKGVRLSGSRAVILMTLMSLIKATKSSS
jgi:hypothetical protein